MLRGGKWMNTAVSDSMIDEVRRAIFLTPFPYLMDASISVSSLGALCAQNLSSEKSFRMLLVPSGFMSSRANSLSAIM